MPKKNRFTLSPTLSLPRIASSLPFTFTGADLYALCSDAMLKAVTRSARAIDARVAALNASRAGAGKQPVTIAGFFDHHALPADLEVLVEEEDFDAARRELVPSVSFEELRHYERVRGQFEGGVKEEDGMAVGEELRQMDGKVEEEKGFARERFNELMARRAAEKAKGKGKGKGAVGVNGGSGDEDEDDFVVRTDKLSINGGVGGRAGSGKGKGKGKGKSREAVVEEDGEGEDLYD